MITRNLAICLGVTGLTSVLLFLYFRHRVGHVEEKMEALFQLIQKEARESMNERIQFNEKMGATSQQVKNEVVDEEEKAPIELTQQKIEVSEDEDSESESDSESDSDDESESEDEGEKLLIQDTEAQVAEVLNEAIETIELKHDVKEEVKEELSDKSGDGDNEDDNSLDEVDLDDLEEDTKEIKLEQIVNYNDMKVGDLKKLAQERQLSGYSHLKKKDLVELLEQNQ